MLGLEAIGNLIAKRAVGALVKMTIDKFDTSGLPENQNKALISKLKSIIEIETKRENSSKDTNYTLQNLHNYYKLAKAYNEQIIFEGFLGLSKEEEQKAVIQIEKRLSVLIEEKEKGIIFNYLSDFYEDKDFEQFSHYNLLTLEYKDNLTTTQEARVYKKLAMAELRNSKYEDALTNIESAIELDAFNNAYEVLKVEILIALNKLNNLKEKIEEILSDYKKFNDELGLSDTYVLLAKYYLKKEQEDEALENFKKAYQKIEKKSDAIFAAKKSYLLTNIALLENNEVKATESIRLNNLQNIRHRLEFLEIANILNSQP